MLFRSAKIERIAAAEYGGATKIGRTSCGLLGYHTA
jgi:hypothetical protein